MDAEHSRLRDSFTDCQIVDVNGYKYFVNPISDGIPRIDRELLEEVIDDMVGISDLDCDMILAPEAMGIPLATGLMLRTGIPYSVIRKRRYGLPGEMGLDQETGYSESPMYINGVEEGCRVAVVDDVVSTGGTMRAIVGVLRSHGAVVTEIIVVYNKCSDVERLSAEIGVPIRYVLSVGVVDDRPVIL